MEKSNIALNMSPKVRLGGYAPSVQYIGRLKIHETRTFAMYHPTINFVFISSPQESIKHSVYINRKLFKTSFPLLVTHIPGCFYENRKKQKLPTEELYISYSKSSLDYFKPIFANLRINCSDGMPPYHFDVTPLMSGLMTNISKIMENIHTKGNPDKLDRLCECLIMEALLNRNTADAPSDLLNSTENKIQKIASFIEINYSSINLDSIIAQNNLSRRSFFRQWKKLFHISPGQYIIQLKLDYATSLLKYTKLQIKEIAEKVNFCDAYHFAKMFHSHYGISATEYRNSFWRKNMGDSKHPN